MRGCLALCLAAQSFDPEKGFTFSSYAVPFISGKLKKYIHRKTQPGGIRPPLNCTKGEYTPLRVTHIDHVIAAEADEENSGQPISMLGVLRQKNDEFKTLESEMYVSWVLDTAKRSFEGKVQKDSRRYRIIEKYIEALKAGENCSAVTRILKRECNCSRQYISFVMAEVDQKILQLMEADSSVLIHQFENDYNRGKRHKTRIYHHPAQHTAQEAS